MGWSVLNPPFSLHSTAYAVLAGVILLVSGCVGPTDSSERPGACTFVYPNGSDLPCRNQAAEAVAEPLPSDAVCLSRFFNADVDLQMHRSVLTEDWYLSAVGPAGQKMLVFDGHDLLVEWEGDGVLKTTENPDLTLLFYNLSSPSYIEIQPLWSLYENTPWLLVKVDVDDEEIYQNMMKSWEAEGQVFYSPTTQELNGTSALVEYRSVGSYFIGRSLGTSCQMELPSAPQIELAK